MKTILRCMYQALFFWQYRQFSSVVKHQQTGAVPLGYMPVFIPESTKPRVSAHRHDDS
jgi:hypothetical protein